MAVYCWVYGVIHFTSPAGWLPVHRDQLRAQRSVTSMGKLYLFFNITIGPIYKDLVYWVSSQKIQWGWASAIWQLDSLFDTVRIVCRAGSIKQSGVRPSVSQSVCPISQTKQRRVAGLHRMRKKISIDSARRPAAAAPQPGAAARRSAANVMLTAELTRLNTDLGYLIF